MASVFVVACEYCDTPDQIAEVETALVYNPIEISKRGQARWGGMSETVYDGGEHVAFACTACGQYFSPTQAEIIREALSNGGDY